MWCVGVPPYATSRGRATCSARNVVALGPQSGAATCPELVAAAMAGEGRGAADRLVPPDVAAQVIGPRPRGRPGAKERLGVRRRADHGLPARELHSLGAALWAPRG